MDQQDAHLREIWQQKRVPVVYRQGGRKPLLIRIPYHPSNRQWLKGAHRNQPEWNGEGKRWETPKSWYEDVVKLSLERFGSIYVIQPFRTQQKCAPACWNADGINCECSCMGANHGSGNPSGRWYVVSETCAVQWNGRQYSCRLVTTPSNDNC